ncbi:Mitochodrial transcription termination factor-related [Cinnamomum micranthum f. kanehirae]|uniref:Mitochodrial transcription termination factor-related n=1 Tax=Cinnamomum micranthum f. kanehirae TaxID=337451 RepID=A0A443PDI5_9MAGN|nr:Mitochodrial transcription termination factor-related [Cinnamomum micranthum f. kanehirae]
MTMSLFGGCVSFLSSPDHLKRCKRDEAFVFLLPLRLQSGFEDTHIKKLISKLPRFLNSKVEKTLKPKFIFFQELGLSGASFADLVAKNPALLNGSIDNRIRPRIDFLRTLVQNDDDVIRVIKRGGWLLHFNLHKIIMPNIEILRRYGASDSQISSCLVLHTRIFTHNPDRLEDVAVRVEQIGFKRGSPMFFRATYALCSLSKATLDAKVKMLKSFGWSEEDVFSAFLKAPLFLAVSERKFRASMRFFLDELGCEPLELRVAPHVIYVQFGEEVATSTYFFEDLEV